MKTKSELALRRTLSRLATWPNGSLRRSINTEVGTDSAQRSTILTVPSFEPSSPMTISSAGRVWEDREASCSGRYAVPLYVHRQIVMEALI
jgi:hypothetical protein